MVTEARSTPVISRTTHILTCLLIAIGFIPTVATGRAWADHLHTSGPIQRIGHKIAFERDRPDGADELFTKSFTTPVDHTNSPLGRSASTFFDYNIWTNREEAYPVWYAPNRIAFLSRETPTPLSSPASDWTLKIADEDGRQIDGNPSTRGVDPLAGDVAGPRIGTEYGRRFSFARDGSYIYSKVVKEVVDDEFAGRNRTRYRYKYVLGGTDLNGSLLDYSAFYPILKDSPPQSIALLSGSPADTKWAFVVDGYDVKLLKIEQRRRSGGGRYLNGSSTTVKDGYNSNGGARDPLFRIRYLSISPDETEIAFSAKVYRERPQDGFPSRHADYEIYKASILRASSGEPRITNIRRITIDTGEDIAPAWVDIEGGPDPDGDGTRDDYIVFSHKPGGLNTADTSRGTADNYDICIVRNVDGISVPADPANGIFSCAAQITDNTADDLYPTVKPGSSPLPAEDTPEESSSSTSRRGWVVVQPPRVIDGFINPAGSAHEGAGIENPGATGRGSSAKAPSPSQPAGGSISKPSRYKLRVSHRPRKRGRRARVTLSVRCKKRGCNKVKRVTFTLPKQLKVSRWVRAKRKRKRYRRLIKKYVRANRGCKASSRGRRIKVSCRRGRTYLRVRLKKGLRNSKARSKRKRRLRYRATFKLEGKKRILRKTVRLRE